MEKEEVKGEMKGALTFSSGRRRLLDLVEFRLCGNSHCVQRIISCPKCDWQGVVIGRCPDCGIPLRGISAKVI